MMDRREFLKAAVAAPAGANMIFQGKRSDRPNLLFLWADQQRPDTMRVYGNSKIHAPNFNKLSEQCAVFQNSYVTQPVCTPSRSTVMTGLWPHANGCTTNNIALAETIPCFPEVLADSSYRTGYYGKWHLGDELFAQHGFQEWESIEDIYNEYFRPGRDRKRRSTYDQFLREQGYKPDSPEGTFSRLFEARLPIEHCKPRFLEQKATDFLRRHRNEPFMLYVNFLEPHPPYFGPLNDEHRVDEMELPPNYAAPLGEDEPLGYRIKRENDRQLRSEGMDLRTDAGWRRFIANYWGNVTHVDRSIGAILKTLEDLGLAENTIVVHTSDHGEMLGSHSMVQKSVMYEQAVKVPWMLRAPRVLQQQRIIKGRFSQIDLVPTLLDLMGKPMPGRFPGRSLVPSIRSGSHPDPVFIEWNAGPVSEADLKGSRYPADATRKALSAQTRTVITVDGWKLCLSNGDKHQLFNLEQDPWEVKNLFYTGRHGDVISRMTKQIQDWQKTAKDSLPLDPGK
jgi:arylsulfatase A-like enzyme